MSAATVATARRVLPVDVFDAMEFVAEREGGIGGGMFGEFGGAYTVRTGEEPPYCVWGIQRSLDGIRDGEVDEALRLAGITTQVNDAAVREINLRRGERPMSRVPFDLWCAALGVERGS